MKFTEDHEWIKIEGETALIGITAYAAKALGDVVFVEPPELGAEFSKGDDMAVVESVKAASDVYAPIDGEVVAVNERLADAPELVNQDPEGEGWFCKLKAANLEDVNGLMDRDSYIKFCDGL